MTLDLEVLADRLSLSQQCARVALGGSWFGVVAGLAFWLDKVILVVISNLDDSVTLSSAVSTSSPLMVPQSSVVSLPLFSQLTHPASRSGLVEL